MQDTLGVMQHHDAITGTSTTRVADDYHRMITEALNNNTLLYSQAIVQHFENYLGLNISNNGTWMQCLGEANNFYDCPITDMDTEMNILVQNPSGISISHATILVP